MGSEGHSGRAVEEGPQFEPGGPEGLGQVL